MIRTAASLVGGTVVIGPDCADPYGPRAVRASMGAVFSQPLLRAGIDATPAPRAALIAHGGEPLDSIGTPATLALGSEREGLPDEVLAQLRAAGDDPAAARRRVAQRRGGGCDRAAADIVARLHQDGERRR